MTVGLNPKSEKWSPRGFPGLRGRALRQAMLSFDLGYLTSNMGVGGFHDFYYADFVKPYSLFSYGPVVYTISPKESVRWNLYLAWTYAMKTVLEGRLGFRMKYLF